MRIERISSWLEAGESSSPLLGDDKTVSSNNESISEKTEQGAGIQPQGGLARSLPIPPLITKTQTTLSYGSIQFPHVVVIGEPHPDSDSDSSVLSRYSNESLWRERNRQRLRRQSSKSLLGNSCCSQYLGLILILFYCIFSSLSGLTVKLLEKDFHAYNICFWRFSSIFVISSVIIICKKLFSKQSMWPRPLVEEKHEHIKNVGLLMLRGALGCGGRILYIYSVTCMALGDSMVIASSSPVFMTVFAYFLLGEKCGVVPVLVAIVTLVGVGVITRPPWLTGGGAYDPNVLLGTGTGFGGMILTTLVMICMRKLRGIYHAVITISFASWGVIVASILSFQNGVFIQPSQWDHILLLVASGVTSFLGQTFLTLGLKYESAGVVALLTNFAVVFSFMFEYIFLHIAPDVYSICGGIIVILCIVVTTFRKWVGTLPEYHEVRRVFFFLLV